MNDERLRLLACDKPYPGDCPGCHGRKVLAPTCTICQGSGLIMVESKDAETRIAARVALRGGEALRKCDSFFAEMQTICSSKAGQRCENCRDFGECETVSLRKCIAAALEEAASE